MKEVVVGRKVFCIFSYCRKDGTGKKIISYPPASELDFGFLENGFYVLKFIYYDREVFQVKVVKVN